MQPPPIENDRYAPRPEPRPPEPSPPKQKWHRFTLRKVLIGFILLSVPLAYLRYTHWGYVAGEAITKLGRNFGMVNPRDTSKIQVTAVRPFGVLDYEWRISIPTGEKYLICHATGQIADDAIPNVRREQLPNEALVSFYLTRGDAHAYRRHGMGKSIHSCDDLFPVFRSGDRTLTTNLDWIHGQLETTGILPENGMQSFKLGERIILIRSITTPPNGSWGTGHVPGDGILIWLEPVPPKQILGPQRKLLSGREI